MRSVALAFLLVAAVGCSKSPIGEDASPSPSSKEGRLPFILLTDDKSGPYLEKFGSNANWPKDLMNLNRLFDHQKENAIAFDNIYKGKRVRAIGQVVKVSMTYDKGKQVPALDMFRYKGTGYPHFLEIMLAEQQPEILNIKASDWPTEFIVFEYNFKDCFSGDKGKVLKVNIPTLEEAVNFARK